MRSVAPIVVAWLVLTSAGIGCAQRPRDQTVRTPEEPAELTAADVVALNDEDSPKVLPQDLPSAPPVEESPQPPLPAPTVLRPFAHIEVDLSAGEVRFEGIACLDIGWLEQIVCTPQTREHETLIVTDARPSELHAALLAAGFEPGEPGRWSYEDDEVSIIPPHGDAISVEVMYERAGEIIREPVREWIRDHLGEQEFPDQPWIFGGSRMRTAPASMGGGEIYTADYSGSVIGLVTFGDEVLGFREVLPDMVEVQPAEWEVNTARVPPPGTPVTVILRKVDAGGE